MSKTKPELKTISFIDFFEAQVWVEAKLGYEIRDTLGCFSDGCVNSVEYRDWWHFFVGKTVLTNGSFQFIDEDLLCGEDWQNEITQCFIDEFGKDCRYMVSW